MHHSFFKTLRWQIAQGLKLNFTRLPQHEIMYTELLLDGCSLLVKASTALNIMMILPTLCGYIVVRVGKLEINKLTIASWKAADFQDHVAIALYHFASSRIIVARRTSSHKRSSAAFTSTLNVQAYSHWLCCLTFVYSFYWDANAAWSISRNCLMTRRCNFGPAPVNSEPLSLNVNIPLSRIRNSERGKII